MGVEPFKDENGIIYFPIGVVSKMIGKSTQMIRLWDSWSDELASNGSDRLIPESHRLGPNRVRHWTLEETTEINRFSRNVKYGDIAEFSRTRWGKRGENLIIDKSTLARTEVKHYRAKVNSNAKKVRNDRKVQEIKLAKGDMIKAIRRRAKSIFND